MREKTMVIEVDIKCGRLRAQREATPARHGWQSAAVFGVGGRQTLPAVRPRNGSVCNCRLVSTGSHARRASAHAIHHAKGKIMKIEGAVVFVTGANRGLGLEFAKQALERGARKVYAGARDPASVTLPGVVPVKLDVTDPAAVAAAADAARDVTLLINNAGIARLGSLTDDGALDALRDHFETNVLGMLAMSRAFAGSLAGNGGGAILNVLSVASWVNRPILSCYGVSKSAAWALTNGLRQSLREQRTQVVGLHAGFIDTDLTRGLEVPKATPADVVRQAYDAIEAGAEEVSTDELTRQVKAGLSAGVYLNDATPH
jgi:NAD(P)-dependent dehydrogenase (short-subunit alcohol dehydrogenase family)